MDACKQKFLALDALRGVGAIMVVFAHIAGAEQIDWLFSNASPGVDLFFVLSGFVIAHCYEPGLQTTLTYGRYLRIRMIRLYPTIVIGGLAGAAAAMLIGHHERFDIVEALPLQLLLIPMFSAAIDCYPMNAATWSLFFELAANFVHGACAKYVTKFRLLAVMAISFVVLVLCALYFHSLNVGAQPRNFIGGFARIGFSFSLGLLLYRLHASGRLRIPKVPVFVPVFGIVAMMAAPAPPIPYGGAIHDLVCVVLVVPVLIMLAVNADVPSRWGRIFAWLGMMSYPLYALHLPIIKILGEPILTPGLPHWIKALGWTGVVGASILIATIVAYRIDAPIRAWLSKRRRVDASPAPRLTSA
jgi:peptidoglycan/LPS O-acetylase OafA/YrhL